MRKCTIGSNRIYQLNEYEKVEKTLLKYNNIFYSTYNLVFFEKENKTKFQIVHGTESLHKIIKAKYNLDDYYANSILQNAKGAYKSQQEKVKDIKSNYKEKLKVVNEKFKKTEKDLIKYIDLRSKLTKHRLETKQGKNNKLKTGFSHISIKGNNVEVRYFKDAKLVKDEYTINKFEYEYLNKKIKYLRSKLGNLKYRINNLNNKINNLKIKHIKFYKYEDTNLVNKKNQSFEISGRKDAGYGNFVFKATPSGKITIYNNPKKKINKNEYDIFNFEIKLIDGTYITLKNIYFKYKGNELKDILTGKYESPICYTLVRKTDKHNKIYYQIFATIDISVIRRINTDISTGIIGVDFNYGHIDITNIDKCGNLIDYFTINYKITNNSKQNEINLRDTLNELGEYVVKQHKVLAIEKLDTSKSKSKSTYRNKDINRIFHNFSYSKYEDMIDYIGIKYEFDIIKVNPAYTSLIGEVKYKYKCLPDHISAAYVIGRRGLKYKEYLPKEFKNKLDKEILKRHHWKQWSEFKKIS